MQEVEPRFGGRLQPQDEPFSGRQRIAVEAEYPGEILRLSAGSASNRSR
jgi:hypothetical protein